MNRLLYTFILLTVWSLAFSQPVPNVEESDIVILRVHPDDNGYSVRVRNNSAQYRVCELGVQTSVGVNNNWTACAGGNIPSELEPNSYYDRHQPRNPGWRNGYTDFKVQIYHFNHKVAERIFPIEGSQGLIPIKRQLNIPEGVESQRFNK